MHAFLLMQQLFATGKFQNCFFFFFPTQLENWFFNVFKSKLRYHIHDQSSKISPHSMSFPCLLCPLRLFPLVISILWCTFKDLGSISFICSLVWFPCISYMKIIWFLFFSNFINISSYGNTSSALQLIKYMYSFSSQIHHWYLGYFFPIIAIINHLQYWTRKIA